MQMFSLLLNNIEDAFGSNHPPPPVFRIFSDPLLESWEDKSPPGNPSVVIRISYTYKRDL
jgi:hypothetical protein